MDAKMTVCTENKNTHTPDKGLAFGLGSGTALDLTPQSGKAQCIKA
jgi:hypothetical protein